MLAPPTRSDCNTVASEIMRIVGPPQKQKEQGKLSSALLEREKHENWDFEKFKAKVKFLEKVFAIHSLPGEPSSAPPVV